MSGTPNKCVGTRPQLTKMENQELGFWSRVWMDLCDRELLPLKILFFVKAATAFVLYPYLNIHSITLGLDVDDVGVTNALTILTIVGQPLAGVFSDKIGNFKVLLTIITLLTPVPALLMLIVPPAREVIPLPENMTFVADCAVKNQSINSLTFQNLEDNECLFRNDTKHSLDRIPSIQCGFLCDQNDLTGPNFPMESLPVPTGKIYSIHFTSKTFSAIDNMTSAAMCEQNDFKTERDLCEIRIGDHGGAGPQALSITVALESVKNDGEHRSQKHKLRGFGLIEGSMSTGGCKRQPETVNPTCELKCIALVQRCLFCANIETHKVYDVRLTFWVYNVLRIFLAVLSSTCWIMFEGAVLAIIKEKGGDYGIQRLTIYVAAIIMTPLSGYLIEDFKDFRPAFYLYAILQVLSGILTMRIHLEFKKPGKQVFGSLVKLLKQAQVLALLAAVLFSGIAWGFLEAFLFLFLEKLGGTGLLLGLTASVSGLAGLPFLVINQPIINRFGHVNTIALGLVFYGIRLVGYSYINDPWMSLPYEALEAVTSSLAITAANTYGSLLSTPETVVSLQGLIGAVYYSVGRAIGGLIGGYFTKFWGEPAAFQIVAAMSVAAGLLYFLFNACMNYRCIKQSISKRLGNLHGRTDDKLDHFRYDGGFAAPYPISDALPSHTTKKVHIIP